LDAGRDRVLICGWKTGKEGRCYVKPVDGGSLEPVTPEGIYLEALVSRDGGHVAARDHEGRGLIYPLAGGEPVEVQGLTGADKWIRWSADDDGILVFTRGQLPIVVERIDIASGRRESVLTIEPANRTSLLTIDLTIDEVTLADDEQHYAYSLWRTRTRLFTVEGLR
jgi:hypothetical protein